jgi:hypothetical protein
MTVTPFSMAPNAAALSSAVTAATLWPRGNESTVKALTSNWRNTAATDAAFRRSQYGLALLVVGRTHMIYKVFAGAPGTEAISPVEKDRWLFKEIFRLR